MLIPGAGIQNLYTPITVGGKLAGNIGMAKPQGQDSSFGSVFQEALDNVNALNAVKSEDTANLAVGNMDDLSAMMANSERADTAFRLLVEVRNKLLDAHSEIMRMNI